MKPIHELLREKAQLNLKCIELQAELDSVKSYTHFFTEFTASSIEAVNIGQLNTLLIKFMMKHLHITYVEIYNDNKQLVMLGGDIQETDAINISTFRYSIGKTEMCDDAEMKVVFKTHPSVASAIKCNIGYNNITYNYMLLESVIHINEAVLNNIQQIIKLYIGIYAKLLIMEQLSKLVVQSFDGINFDPKTKVHSVKALENDKKAYSNKIHTYVFMDLDKFKSVNDTYGHDMGDVVLIEFAKYLNKYAKYLNGKAYRYGGEEFIIITPEPLNSVVVHMDKLRIEFSKHTFTCNEVNFNVTTSIGICTSKDGLTPDECIKCADERLYKAKHTGRNRICYD